MIQYLKCVYKEVEYWLYNYQQYKSELETALEDFAYSRSSFASEYIPNTGFVSNPVERAAIEYEKRYAKIEKWIKVIDKALEILKQEHKKKYMLLIMRYFKGYRKERIIEELEINEKTYQKWKDDIVELVAILAIEQRLIKVKT